MKSRKIIVSLALSLIIGIGFIFVSGVSAQGPLLSQSLIDEAECSGGQCSLNTFVKVGLQVSEIILGLVGALSLIMFVYGGVTWLISGGSAEKVTQGKEIIVGAVVGLLIVFGSYTIIKFVVNDVLDVTKEYEFTGDLPKEDSVPRAIGSRCESNGGICMNNTASCVDGYSQPGQLIATDCGKEKKCCKLPSAPAKTCETEKNNGRNNMCDITCLLPYMEMAPPALPCLNNRKCCQYQGSVGS